MRQLWKPRGKPPPRPRYEVDAFAASPVPVVRLLIGTHHKTGSVWLQNVFRTFAFETHASFVHAVKGEAVAGTRRTVLFDGHSRFEGVERAAARGLHMVRDPRDVVVSSMHYHRRAAEPWLHEPRFEGLTYQQKINTYDDTDAMLFELDECAGRTIAAMRDFQDGPSFRTVRYEDLIDDVTLERWHDAFLWLGLSHLDLVLAFEAAHANSRFGGRESGHMRGAATAWEKEMPERVLARYEAMFGDAAQRLGYAPTGLASAA